MSKIVSPEEALKELKEIENKAKEYMEGIEKIKENQGEDLIGDQLIDAFYSLMVVRAKQLVNGSLFEQMSLGIKSVPCYEINNNRCVLHGVVLKDVLNYIEGKKDSDLNMYQNIKTVLEISCCINNMDNKGIKEHSKLLNLPKDLETRIYETFITDNA